MSFPPDFSKPPPGYNLSSVPEKARIAGETKKSKNWSCPVRDIKKEKSSKHFKKEFPSTSHTDVQHLTERDKILKNYRQHFCKTENEIVQKLEEFSTEANKDVWVRSSPAEIYYKRVSDKEVNGTPRLERLHTTFDEELVKRADKVKVLQKNQQSPHQRKRQIKICRHKSEKCCSSSDSSSDTDLDDVENDSTMEELTRKTQHPYRLHTDLWHNETGEMNDGPLCRCSARSRRYGIRHGIFPGETGYPKCDPNSNNAHSLYHYRITISPPTNFLTKTPTIIKHDQHEFLFEGFSLLAHEPIADLPTCKVVRFNIEYAIIYVSEEMPQNFTIHELELFNKFLFNEILELVDFSLEPSSNTSTSDSCPAFHFLPRFVRDLPENGKEVLAMAEVLR